MYHVVRLPYPWPVNRPSSRTLFPERNREATVKNAQTAAFAPRGFRLAGPTQPPRRE